MDEVGRFLESIKAVVAALRRPELEPFGGKAEATAVDDTVAKFRAEVLEELGRVSSQLEAADRSALHSGLQDMASQLVALLVGLKRHDDARALLHDTLKVVPSNEVRGELGAATRELELFDRLMFARWARSRGEGKKAIREAHDIARASREPALIAAAKALSEQAVPASAPKLYTVNGFGTKLYGRSDAQPDGTYTATLYLVGLFVPLFPLARYVVSDGPNGSWYFHGKKPLSRLQVLYRRGALVAVALATVGYFGFEYFQSKPYQARAAITAAKKLEASGDTAGALKAYAAALDTFASSDVGAELEPALERWLDLRWKGLSRPCDARSADEVLRLLRRVGAAPSPARGTRVQSALHEQLGRCVAEIGTGTRSALKEGTELLAAAQAAVGSGYESELKSLERALARSWGAEGWPVLAIEHALAAGDQEMLAFAGQQLSALGEAGTLYAEEAPLIEQLVSKSTASPEVQAAAKKRLGEAQALERRADRAEALEATDASALDAASKAAPGDQALAVAWVRSQLAQGQARLASSSLATLGPRGGWTVEAQLASVFVHRALGEVEAAEAEVSGLLERHLPRYLAARDDFEARLGSAQDRLVADAKAGRLPADVSQKLEAARLNEAKQGEIFRDFVQEKLRTDADLLARRDHLRRLYPVVEASILWGSALLQRASHLEGAARTGKLEEAERAFLAVRGDADDSPSFHLGYGQVLHRLGKTKEGDAELQALVAAADPRMRLEVARVYRELGLMAQARQVAEAVYGSAGDGWDDEAASFLAVAASTLDEKERWLGKVHKASPYVKAELASVKGSRLMEEGHFAEAAKHLQEAADFRLRDASSNPISANNAAIDLMKLSRCKGDRAPWERAVRLLKSAVSQVPDNAVALNNTASILAQNAAWATLESIVSAKKLGVTGDESTYLLQALVDGPRRDEVTRTLAAHPDLKRALELLQQHHVLAPRSASTWADHAHLLRTIRDTEGMLEVARQAASAGPIDNTDSKAASERRTKPEERERRYRWAEAGEAHLAEAGEHLRGVPRLVNVSARCAVSLGLRPVREALARSVALCREAGGWTDANTKEYLAWALARQGVYEVASKAPELRAALETSPTNEVTTAWKLARAKPDIALALASDASLREAAELIHSDPHPSLLTGVRVAELARNPAVKEHVKAKADLSDVSVSLLFDRLTEDPDLADDEAAIASAFDPVPPNLRAGWLPGASDATRPE